MTKNYIPLGFLSILTTGCDSLSIDLKLDQETGENVSEIIDILEEYADSIQNDDSDSNEEEVIEDIEDVQYLDEDGYDDDNEDGYDEQDALQDTENDDLESVDGEQSDQDSNEDVLEDTDNEEIIEEEDSDLEYDFDYNEEYIDFEEEEFESDEEESVYFDDSPCDDFIQTERRALWIQTDSISNSNPYNTGGYGSSEAAQILENQGVVWETIRMSDMNFDPQYLMNYDLIIIYGQGTSGPLSDVDAAVLEYWVLQGGGLLYHTYHPTDASCEMLNSLPSNFGIS